MMGEDDYISVAKLRRMLTMYGEKITDDVFDSLISMFPENAGGMIKTKSLIDVILDPTIKYTEAWLASQKEDVEVVTGF